MNDLLRPLASVGLAAGLAATLAVAQSPFSVIRNAGRIGAEPQLVGAGGMVTSLLDLQPVAFANGQTWRFTGDRWDLLASGGPTVISGYGIASDALRQRIVLFGGSFPDGSPSNETWEFDGVAWARIATTNAPSPRINMVVGYDSIGQEVMLFGGNIADGSYTAETWTYDGAGWTLRTPSAAPTPRSAATFASSPSGPSLLFGGLQGPDVQSDETWLYSQRNWQLLPGAGPSPRYRAALTFDPVAVRFVLAGGERNQLVSIGSVQGLQVDVLSDVWEFDLITQSWSQATLRGDLATTSDAVAAYDIAQGQVIIRSVLANTNRALRRELPGQNLSATRGDGCLNLLNPLASPELAVVGADRPIPGTTLTVRGRNLPDAGLSVLTLGLSDQFQGSTPLPAPLSSFGLAGACPLLASADLFNPVATANGAFDAPLPVPAGSVLLGLRLFLQVLAAESLPFPLPLPVLTSNALEFTIGF
jgi:hypothetical protein